MEVAIKFYGQFLPQLGFVRERHEPSPRPEAGGDFHAFYSAGTDKPSEFFAFDEDKNHQPNRTRIAFWAERKSIVLQSWFGKPAEKIWRVRKSVSITPRAITRSSSRTLTGTNWKSAAGKIRSLLDSRKRYHTKILVSKYECSRNLLKPDGSTLFIGFCGSVRMWLICYRQGREVPGYAQTHRRPSEHLRTRASPKTLPEHATRISELRRQEGQVARPYDVFTF